MDVAKAGELQAMYEASARRHRERIREGNRWEWVRFFDRLAANHARISQEFERRAEALLEDPKATVSKVKGLGHEDTSK